MDRSQTRDRGDADASLLRSAPVVRALGRLAGLTGSAAVLVTGALLTYELWGDALGLELVAIPLFWGLALALLVVLVVPTWRGDRWRRRGLGACALVGCAGALHWLSYEPVPGSGSYAIGVAVAVLLGTAAAAAVLAEAVTARGHHVVAAASAAALAAVVAWAFGAFPTATERYTNAWTAPQLGGPGSTDDDGNVTDQVRSVVGPERCGWESVVLLHVAWPLETPVDRDRAVTSRVYVRDSEEVLPPAVRATLAGPLDTDSSLPALGVDTGYRSGDVQLLLGPDDGEQYVYVVDGRDVERWPRAAEPPACG